MSYNVPINVTVVTSLCLVFNVRRINGDLPGLFLGSLVDIFVGHAFGEPLVGEYLGDGLCQCRLSVIDMTDGSNVDMRFVAVKGGRQEPQRRRFEIQLLLKRLTHCPRQHSHC